MKLARSLFQLPFALALFVGAVLFNAALAGTMVVYQSLAQVMPMCPLAIYANSNGTLYGTQIIRRAFQICFTAFPSLKAFSQGFKELDGSVEGAALGQDVVSRILVPSSVTNFGTAASDFSATDVTGKLRNMRQIYHKFTAAEVNSTQRNFIDESAMPMAIGLAQEITRAMAAMVSRSNFNAAVNSKNPYLSVASGWTFANTLLPLIGLLDDRGVPKMGQRFFMPNSAVNIALMGDSALYAAYNNSQNSKVISEGEMPQIVTGLKYEAFPALSPSDSNLVGFAGTPDALTYMARAPKTPDEAFAGAAARAPFVYGIITDEKSGFSVMVQQWIATDLSIHTRLAWIDGYSVGNTRNLIRLINGVVAGTSGVPVAAATVTNPGYGYTNGTVVTAPDVTVVAVGAGSGATATATVDTVGAVTGITVAAGTGYTSGFTLTITPASGGRCDAPATATGATSGLN